MNILKNVINKLSQEEKKEVNLASEKVELGLIDDLNKLKKRIESEYKTHNNKLNSFAINSRKILSIIDNQKKEGIALDKEANQIRKIIDNYADNFQKLKKQANNLGLDLPQGIDLIGGVDMIVFSNKLNYTSETIEEFLDQVK